MKLIGEELGGKRGPQSTKKSSQDTKRNSIEVIEVSAGVCTPPHKHPWFPSLPTTPFSLLIFNLSSCYECHSQNHTPSIPLLIIIINYYYHTATYTISKGK